MSYVGMAANIVGGELQGWAALLERQNMFDEFQREQRQQQAFGNMGQGIFQDSLSNYGAGAANRDLAQAKSDRMKSYQDVADVPLGFGGGGKGFATDAGYSKLLGGNRAGLGAYSDFALKQALASGNTQRLLNQLASSAGGSASIYPYYMYGAQHSMDDLATIGQAISSIGGGAANYAQTLNSGVPGGGGVTYQQGAGGGPPMEFGGYGGWFVGSDGNLYRQMGGSQANYWDPSAGSKPGWDY